MSHGILKQMLEIYQPDGIDWMGYKVSRKNPYTFHHIQERRNGGRSVISNGAILTKQAHAYLNYLEQFCPMAYDEYQAIFKWINSYNGPIPPDDYEYIYDELYALAYDIEKSDRFVFYKDARNFKLEKKEINKMKTKTRKSKNR